MKTTFKTVFNELDDELMDMELNTAEEVADIDVEKIKGEVLMRIKDNGKNNGKKKFSKKLTVILVAAVILITGTVGAFATGSVQQIFGRLFHNGSTPNALGLYDGGIIDIKTNDDNLDIKLLGVTGDGERLYSAIEITRKDGSPVIEEGYDTFSNMGNFKNFQTEYTDSDGNKMSVTDSCRYILENNNKTLTVYLYSMIFEGKLQNGRITGSLNNLDVFKIEQVLASMDLPEMSINSNPEDEHIWFDDTELAQKRQAFGLSEDECIYIDHENKREYCKANQKNFTIDFTISYDFNYSDEYFITQPLNIDSIPQIFETPNIQNAEFTVTPLGIYVSGENADNSFKVIDKDSKIILNDGTAYYLYAYEGYHEGLALNYSTVPKGSVYTQINVIDTREVKSVIINGETVYQR